MTVSRLVPSRLISFSSPAWEDEDNPSTATMAATPMAMPSADSPARSRRVRNPTLARRAGRGGAAGGRSGRRRSRPGSPRWREAGGVSATMRPSSISTRRGIRAAMAWSWVMTTMVVPRACRSSRKARMEAPVAWSRLPVGSSASTMAGRPTRARAIATRWRSPPDSWVGRALARRQADRLQGVQRGLTRRAAGPPHTATRRPRSPPWWCARPRRTVGTRTRSAWLAARPAHGR